MEDGLVRETDSGTAQGSILSPLLSNVYLHHALDQWVQAWFKDRCQGVSYYFRFADDFLACFQHQREADAFLTQLSSRLAKFSLRLAPAKTRRIEFGRFARDEARERGHKPDEFTFLGFTHSCGKTREGYFKVKHRTIRKQLTQSLRNHSDWVRRA
jgi:RNA-directed DNA polymerase